MANSILDIHSNVVAYADVSATNNPRLRHVDWTRHLINLSVKNPLSSEYTLAPGASLTVFNGTRSTTIDGTTTFALTLNSAKASTYRMTATAGTAPGFRTNRALTLNTEVVTVTVNNNATVQFALSSISAGTFAAVSVGDVVWVPNTSTGDSANVFSETNSGFWTVLAVGPVSMVANKVLTLKRLAGTSFSGVAEVVTLTANTQLQAFSSAGVQVTDKLEIVSGFSSVSQKTFEISAVSHDWVEFSSTAALPLESGILPTSTGLVFYTAGKKYLRIDVDQEAVVRLNGDTTNNVKVSPIVSASRDNMGWLEKYGSCYTLTVVNKSVTDSMVLHVISAE